MITSTVKEEPPSFVPNALVMNLKCDYCGGDVTSSRPYTISADFTVSFVTSIQRTPAL